MTFVVLAIAQPVVGLAPSRKLTQSVQRIWQVQQGLPNGSVYRVYQTRDRHLWLGTRTGLVRFDGIQFTAIRNTGEVSLENVWIHDLAEDEQGNLWIATDRNGLIRWKNETAKRFGVADGLPSETIYCVRSDRNGNLWAGTDHGLARIQGEAIKAVTSGSDASTVEAIGECVEGQIFFAGTAAGLARYANDERSPIKLSSIAATSAIHALHCSTDGSLWIGTSDGLVRLQNGTERRFTTDDGLTDNGILCLTEGADGSLWVGTNDGFNRLRKEEIEPFRTRDGLSQSTVYTICEDHEGTLWVGTKLGLNQFFDRRTLPFTTAEGLPSNNVGPIAQSANGDVWLGTLGAGLARYDGRNFHVVTRNDGLPSDTIHALAADKAGNFWVGTTQGLCRLKERKIVETLTAEQGLPSSDIRALNIDASGTLWIGTTAGLSAWRDGKFVKLSGNDGDLAKPISVIECIDDGATVIAAHGDGLLRCVADRMEEFSAVRLPALSISVLYQDSQGWLLVGTRGEGLYVYDGKRTSHLSVRDGLYDDDIVGITADNHNNLWMACSKGIFSLERGQLDSFAAGTVSIVETTPLSPLDALRTVECQSDVQPAVQKMCDGRIWFATMHGALVVDPSHWQRVLPASTVVVEEVIINGKSVNPTTLQAIAPGPANLNFRYTALSYTSPTRITFRYRLEGFDPDWIDAGTRREAFYTNLPAGEYKFRVTARNVDGKDYEASTPINLRIDPHFYQARWFLPACAAVLFTTGGLLYRLRVRHLRERMHIVVAERSRIARELHDTLMQGFSGITMEMQALSTRLPASSERESLEEIIGDAGNCLREARRSIAGLRGDHSGLALAIGQTARQLTETQDVRLAMNLAAGTKPLPVQVEYNLLRIVQEALANAVKHSGGDVIHVSLEESSNELRLSIRDDGIGFTMAEDEAFRTGHYGLIGMQERAKQIGADFRVESRRGHGSVISVVLPLPAQPTLVESAH